MQSPGPLTFSPQIGNKEACFRALVFGADKRTVATLEITNDERVATDYARLLAAAPDLLEACKLAFAACQDNLKMYMYKNEELLHKAFEACKAAIEKATTDADQTSARGGSDAN